MKDSKFISIIKTFTQKELKLFDKFVISPVYNIAGIYVVKFYSEIRKYYPDFQNSRFTKENIFKELYPDVRYSDSTFRKLSSEMMKLCEKFLIFNRLSRNKILRQSLLLEELDERKLDRLFEIKYKEIIKLLGNDDLKYSDYYYNLFRLSSMIKTFYFSRDRKKSIEYFNIEAENFLNYFCLSMVMSYIERLKEKRNFTDSDFKLPMLNEVMSYIRTNNLISKNAFKIFTEEFALYSSNKDEHYFNLKALKNKYYKKLSRSELNSIYTTLVNYAAEKYEKGEETFLKELHEMNKESLKKSGIGGYLSEFQFINIVTVSLRLNETGFAENFIKKYSGRLNQGIRRDTINFCNANISFIKQNYKNTLTCLLKINFKQIQQKFLVKNLTLKTYYELKQFDPIHSLIDSYKHIIKREKLVPQNIKILLTNFIKFVKELTELSEGRGEKKEILNRVKKSQTAEKIWLTEKLK
jgi:hypothetical protein